jgi:hypothetical protein
MANTVVAGYATYQGNKIRFIFDHYGPASYVQWANTPAGDIVNASDFGFGGFDSVFTPFYGYSNSGNYIVIITPCLANDIPAGGPAKRFTARWFTTSAAFGTISTEVTATTNLSAEYVRIGLDAV